MADALSPTMTLRDFENGYWYLEQLKTFAERIGIPAAKKLRKDELEKAIASFLRTGKAALPTKRSLRKTGVKDVERGLDLKLRIENYTSNRETKDFIVEQAHLMAPEIREKSGVWYRLNRWREKQITSGKHPTYGDLVRRYIALNSMKRFEKIRHGRYINFVAEFLAADKGVTRAEAIAAWTELKRLDVPKDYASWVRVRAKLRSILRRRRLGARGAGQRRLRIDIIAITKARRRQVLRRITHAQAVHGDDVLGNAKRIEKFTQSTRSLESPSVQARAVSINTSKR